MADTIRITADTSAAIRSVNNLENSLQGLQGRLAGLGNAIAGLALGGFITNAVRMADAIADISNATGLSTQAILGFNNAIEENGGSYESAQQGLLKFIDSIGQAADGNIKAQETFSKLGVSLNDLATLSEQDLLGKTIQGLGRITDVSQRAALGMDLFGKAAKGTDFRGVANSIDTLTAAQAKNADAIKSASDVAGSLDASYRELQIQTLNALKPLADLATVILSNRQAVADFIESAVRLAAALGSLFVIGKVVGFMSSAAMASVAAGAGFASMASSMLGLTTIITKAKDAWYLLSAVFSGIKNMFVGGAAAGGILRAALAALLGGAARLIPVLGWLYTAFEVVDFIMKRVTSNGEGLFATLDRAGKAIANFMGIQYQTSKEKDDLAKKEKDAADKAKEAADRQAQAQQRIRDVVLNTNKELAKQLDAYKASNADQLKQIQNNTALIGLSEEQRTRQQALFDLESRRLKEVTDLEGKMREAQLPEAKRAYADAIKNVNAEYEKNKTALNGALDAQIQKTRQEQLSVFANEQLVNAIRQLNDLNYQAATALLPELEKKYRDIEKAAQDAAQAQIAAEEQRRGAPLSEAERARYLEAARVKTDELKAATERLDAAERQRALNNFALKERIDLENQLQKIQDDTAKLTMTEMERKEYDIAAAARDRAKAEIDAAEARRGAPLDAAERQAYYDKARAGVERLQAAERAHYEESRTWEVGWKRAFDSYVEDATNASKRAEDVFKKATQGMEDALVNFAKTGKFEWKSFINSLLEDLLRSQLKQLIGSLFGSFGGGGGGGNFFTNLLGSIFGRAAGGPVNAGTPYIVGERGPELFMPTASGNIVPNGALGGSVTYNINAVDAMSFKQMIARDPAFIHSVAQQGARAIPNRRA